MESSIRELINNALKEAYGLEGVEFTVEHPRELSHGDYSTNVALLAFKGRRNFERAIDGNSETVNVKYGIETTTPYEFAQKLKKIMDGKNQYIKDIKIASSGFINFSLTNNFFETQLENILKEKQIKSTVWKGKKVMVEYTDPNPFKPFHIGHLMTNAIGESIARIITASGGDVIRANYQGDVGLHVAKAIWGLNKSPNGPGKLKRLAHSFAISSGLLAKKRITRLAQFIGNCYVSGSENYENNENAKKEIDLINREIYTKDNNSINGLYKWGRKVTLAAFEEIYDILGTEFDKYFYESEMTKKGTAIVMEFLKKGVFEESDGAIVFKAEKYNPKLHTRVFITSKGLPTYETKELGLTETKFEKYELDKSIVITAVEQKDYMAVATEAMRHIHPEYALKMKHITHGMMRFADSKMSSRKGNVITGESLLKDAISLAHRKALESKKSQIDVFSRHMPDYIEENDLKIERQIAVAAIKYSILKQAIGKDIIYDPEQSVSFEGDSGPYLQYATTRAKNVIRKANFIGISKYGVVAPLEPYEIEKILYRFPEVVDHAAQTLEPHLIVTFLIELSSKFNSFYNNEKIADETDQHASYKVSLTKAFVEVMVKGLYLLGIAVPEKM